MQVLQQPDYINNLELYDAISESMRAEVFDGKIEPMPIPHRMHQGIVMKLSYLLHSYIRNHDDAGHVYPAPFDVKLSESPLTLVHPDIMIVCDRKKLCGCRCSGAPDFISEIVSPQNPSIDYIKKLYYYQRFQIREYWIIDPDREIVTVNYFEKEIISCQYPLLSKVKVNIYDDFYIDFNEIFV